MSARAVGGGFQSRIARVCQYEDGFCLDGFGGFGGLRTGEAGDDAVIFLEGGFDFRMVVKVVFLHTFDDFVHLSHGSLGVFPHGGFGAEHHGIGSIEAGVGNITDFGSGGADVFDHTFEHMGRHDHGFGGKSGFVNEFLLENRHLRCGYFDSQVSSSDHQGIGYGDDLVYVVQCFGFFYFGYDGYFRSQISDHGL